MTASRSLPSIERTATVSLFDYDDNELGRELTAARARIASLEETNAELNTQLAVNRLFIDELERKMRLIGKCTEELLQRIEHDAEQERQLQESPDYAALGYEETQVGKTGQFTLDVWVDRLLFSMLDAGVDWVR